MNPIFFSIITYIIAFIIIILLPVSIAWFIGRHRKIGFWLSLLACYCLTPFLGYMITEMSARKNAETCPWCNNNEKESEFCGLCHKNEAGEIRVGFENEV